MQSAAQWSAKELESDQRWIFDLTDTHRDELLAAIGHAPQGADLLSLRGQDFDLGSAWPVIRAAVDEVKFGRGVALLRGLPRDGLDEKSFELMSWAIGLHVGVARPQGNATQYISAVRDAGTTYRSGKGRGYSSNAELDFHTDSADIVFLSCYNRAASGGMSITTSTLAAYEQMAAEHPHLLDWLHTPIHFSRQGEEAPDENPTCLQPVYGRVGEQLFCRWNWNRVNTALQIPGVAPLADAHREALVKYDEIVRRPALAHNMWMNPGDVLMVNSHVTLHSRTEFVDDPQPERKRLMYRLWLAPPDSSRLPDAWRELYRSIDAGTVRGGIRGRNHGDACKAYESQQAAELGMPSPT